MVVLVAQITKKWTVHMTIKKVAVPVIGLIGALATTSSLAQSLPGEGNACLPALGNGQICTAKELRLSMELISAPSACQAGELIEITGRVLLSGTGGNPGGATERYSVGFFVGENGGPAIDPQPSDTCAVSYLTPNTGVVDLGSGAGPYKELSSTADACGDVDTKDRTFHDVTTTQILCQDTDGDGRVDISAAATWETNKNQNCSSPPVISDFYPKQSSKCIYEPRLGIDIPVEQAPALHLVKEATPKVLREPGGTVIYTVSIENISGSTDPITINSLLDDRFGDLNGQGDCETPLTLPPGTGASCSFQQSLAGVAGDLHTNIVTAQGADDEGRAVTASDDAVVVFLPTDSGVTPPPEPAIDLVKTGSVADLPKPGGEVEYTLTVSNTGDSPLTLTALTDDQAGGSLNGTGSCELPQYLPIGARYDCGYEQNVTGRPGDVITNTAQATAQTTGSVATTVTATDSFDVAIYDLPASLRLVKTPLQSEVTHPGAGSSAVVDYRLLLINESLVDSIVITALTDTQQEGSNAPTAPIDVNTLAVPSGKPACALPITLSNASSATGSRFECYFSRSFNGDNVSDLTPGTTDIVADTVVATGEDDENEPVSAAASAQVVVSTVPPGSIEVVKTASPRFITNPPENVRYRVEVINTSEAGTVTVTGLSDSVEGQPAIDITDTSQVITSSCLLPQVIALGASYDCEFVLAVDGSPGQGISDIVSAEGTDAAGNPLAASDEETVVIGPAGLDIDVTKTPSANIVSPGQAVTFTIEVTNNSSQNLALVELNDSVYGNLDGQGDCQSVARLTAGDTYRCAFDALPIPNIGPLHVNTVLATASRLDKTALPGGTVTESDRAYVLVLAGGAATAVPLGGSLVLLVCLGLLWLAKRRLAPSVGRR